MKPRIDRAFKGGHAAKMHEVMPVVRDVRWSSRGSGVTYTRQRVSQRQYYGMKLNRVAERLVADAPKAGASRLIPAAR